MKAFLLRVVRTRALQPLWELVYRASLVGMNFWSSHISATGEIDALRRIADRLPADPVIFDVGANTGDFTSLCLQYLPAGCVVHAFEPSAATFDLLRTQLAGARNDRVHLHNLGFSDTERDDTLHYPEPGSTLATVYADGGLAEKPNRLTEQIRLTTIDAFCSSHGIDRIHFLKLDIEGHEHSALRGARRMLEQGRIQFLQFEFGENNLVSRTYIKDFVGLLGERYRMFRVVPGGLVAWRYRGGYSEIFATMNYFCELRDECAALRD
jgi:FkbM family methyltransferase